LISTDFGNRTDLQIASTLVSNLGLSAVSGLDAWVAGQLTSAGAGNKGAKIISMLNDFSNMSSTDATYGAAVTAFNTKVDAAQVLSQTTGNTGTTFAAAGTTTSALTFTLTTGVDSPSSTSGNDSYNAPAGTFTSLDAINGGAGTDTLNWVTTGAVTAGPASSKLTGIETINYTTDNAYTLNLATDAVFSGSGVTTFNGVNAGAFAVDLTAAATTDLSVTNTTAALGGSITVNGGKAVTVTAASLRASTEVGAAISVGASTAAAGAVNVTESFSSGNVTGGSVATGGLIGVTGGTTINITQNIAATSAAAATALTGSISTSVVGGVITATGNASTTAATVTQSATVAAVSSATIGRIGITAGAVNILDANRASSTAAGTITTASVTNAGAVTVNSGALTNLNIGGTLTTVDASTLGALTTVANTSLALGLTGAVSSGAVTIDPRVTTLNITGNTTASTINSLVTSASAINVDGAAKVTLTGLTDASLTTFTVTNTVGASTGTGALGTGVTFTGGAGADTIVIGATTKAITMGAGNDQVTTTGLVGTGGSVDAGDGVDIVVMTNSQANVAAGSSTFNSKFKNFETLTVSDSLAATLDLDGINGATTVNLSAAVGGGTLNNLSSGGTVKLTTNDGGGNVTIGVKGALLSNTDVLNLALSKSTALTNSGTVTVANVETININTADSVAAGSDAAIHQLILAATTATSLVVTGNNGLNLSNTGNVAITNFDASGVVGNSTTASTFVAATTDSAANLAVTFASANSSTTAAVTIKGGAGNDSLSGLATIDTISGGGGNDIIAGGTGADVLDGGTGIDTVSYADVTASTSHSLTNVAGMVINLSASTVTAATLATAMATAAGPTAPVIGGGAGVSGSDSAAGTGSYLAVSAATSIATMVRDTLTGFESVTGSALRDYIVASSTTGGTIQGALGADYIIAGTGVDTFLFGDLVGANGGDGVTATASGVAGGTSTIWDLDETLTFGNGVDIISGFTPGATGDIIKGVDAGAPTAALSLAAGATTGLAAGTTYYLSGNYVQSTGIFTVKANGSGTSTLIIEGEGTAQTTNTSMVLLLGVNSADLVAANFIA